MNTYSKFAPNVFLAKCTEKQDTGSVISVTTKYGKENECIVFNLVYEKDGFYFYSIVRADGLDSQEFVRRKADRLKQYAANAEKKSDEYYVKSNKDSDFLSLAEPIKIGHHSEKWHRKVIHQSQHNMGKSVEFSDKAKEYKDRADYWESRSEIINLSMPESLDFFEFELEKAKKLHAGIKAGEIERRHSYSLVYAQKNVKELEKKLKLAKALWA